MIVRAARPADAEAIVHIHYAAVQAIPLELYSVEVKEAWSRCPDEARFEWMRKVITQAEELVVVADEGSGILGFGVADPRLCELRALYVHPMLAGRGIGRALLQELESVCMERGIRRLSVNASLNAERFYRGNGYRSLQRDTFILSPEHRMACVKMEKDL
jgi:putative acetyltransferase